MSLTFLKVTRMPNFLLVNVELDWVSKITREVFYVKIFFILSQPKNQFYRTLLKSLIFDRDQFVSVLGIRTEWLSFKDQFCL